MNTANPYAPPRATVQDVADSAATAAGLIARQCIHDKIAGTIVIKA
jgi:hypothetical protein